MKKIYIIVLIIITLLIGFFFLNKTNEFYITDHEYLYDLAVDYLKNQDNNPDSNKNGYHFFIKYDGLGITEDDNYQYAYMWVLGESYYLNNSKVEISSGYSMFHKFTFKNNKILKVTVPKDGSEYVKSIKEMCPDKKMVNKVLDYELEFDLENQIQDYYHNNIIELDKNNNSSNNLFNKYIDTEEITIFINNNINEIYFNFDNKKRTLKEYYQEENNIDITIKTLIDLLNYKETVKDGGTTIYNSSVFDITVIKCNTIEGNKDVYIGDNNLDLSTAYLCHNNQLND